MSKLAAYFHIDPYALGMIAASVLLAAMGLYLNIFAIIRAKNYKKDDKFCNVLLYSTLIGNCVALGILTITTTRIEIEGQLSVHYNYGLCCLLHERVCNLAEALIYQWNVFFPLMIMTILICRTLGAMKYRYQIETAAGVVLFVFLVTFPRFVLHVVNYNKTIDVASELSQRTNVLSRNSTTYSIRLNTIMVLSEIVYGYVPVFVLFGCTVIGTAALYQLSTDWDTYGTRARRMFNGRLSATMFDCFFISFPYFFIDMDLIGKFWPASTQLYLVYFKQHFIALAWAIHGLIMLIFVPYMRRYFIVKIVDWLNEFENINIRLTDSDAED